MHAWARIVFAAFRAAAWLNSAPSRGHHAEWQGPLSGCSHVRASCGSSPRAFQSASADAHAFAGIEMDQGLMLLAQRLRPAIELPDYPCYSSGDDDPVRMGCCPRAGVGQTFGQGIELVAAVEDAMGRAARLEHDCCRRRTRERPMPQRNDLSRSAASLTTNPRSSRSSRSASRARSSPRSFQDRTPSTEEARGERGGVRSSCCGAGRARRPGRPHDRARGRRLRGRPRWFLLARWLRAHGIEAHVIHPTSVAVSREHRRAKTDQLDTRLLRQAFLARCAASRTTAAWSRSRRSRKRTPSARTRSGRA